MPIAFVCPRCGKSYSVDDSLAGRKGRCAACGRAMTVPNFVDDGDDTIATDGYDLSEPLPETEEMEASSVFVPAGLEPEVPRTARRLRAAPSPSRPRPRHDEDAEPFLTKYGPPLIVAALLLIAGLGLTALIVPNGSLIAACVLAVVGGLMVLVGYCVGLWASFREDFLYGFAYLVFPLYTAYYFVTRWDDLWPYFTAMTLGAGLVVLGGTIAEAKLKDRPPAAARVEVRAKAFFT
jgi:hypothetical protein